MPSLSVPNRPRLPALARRPVSAPRARPSIATDGSLPAASPGGGRWGRLSDSDDEHSGACSSAPAPAIAPAASPARRRALSAPKARPAAAGAPEDHGPRAAAAATCTPTADFGRRVSEVSTAAGRAGRGGGLKLGAPSLARARVHAGTGASVTGLPVPLRPRICLRARLHRSRCNCVYACPRADDQRAGAYACLLAG